jgi:hypothetical protein
VGGPGLRTIDACGLMVVEGCKLQKTVWIEKNIEKGNQYTIKALYISILAKLSR